MALWVIGQRCASLGEPALGLGIIKEIGPRNIQVTFPAVGTSRIYAKDSAPLTRVRFEPGEVIRDAEGRTFTVVEVKQQNGLLIYLGDTEVLPETDVDHAMVFSRPEQQLLAGHVYTPNEFDLRCKAWQIKYQALSNPCRGLLGGRIELVPHQLFIASEVARRHHPRVLLSDEVGLGKTIEAGLIFHQLWVTGEVKRVLCLVPGHLVTQWLTELYRKFNILFSIMTPDHAEELGKIHPNLNPYQCHQTVIQNLWQLNRAPQLREQMLDAEWDLVIVDEAHHLLWSEGQPSPEYQLVANLSQTCGGILLLTATPRQLGMESHFGRLKLLDSHRFSSFEAFNEETRQYVRLAEISDRVLAGTTKGIAAEIAEVFPNDRDLIGLAGQKHLQTPQGVQNFLDALIDRHGTGRIIYRNRRKVLSGFPKRIVSPTALSSSPAYIDFLEAVLGGSLDGERGQKILAGAPAFAQHELPGSSQAAASLLKKAWREDPRLKWLVSLLRQKPNEKFLLICSHKAIVLALQEWLGLSKDIDLAVFHEDLNLLERDRQAAFFARPEGARVLLCSEIGSEGRNFQFASNLILFDLPLNPALLEQRIGRLDRIGQRNDIQIYIPYPSGSPLEYLFRFYEEALDAFAHHLAEGDYIHEHLESQIRSVFKAPRHPEEFGSILRQSRKFMEHLKVTIAQGRDRLLELNSFRKDAAERLAEVIAEIDQDQELGTFMDGVFDLFRIDVEDQVEQRTQILRPSAHMPVLAFPGLPDDGLEITYSRDLAVVREDLTFLSLDHPMVNGAIDLILNTDRGTTNFCLWKKAPQPGILVQCLFVQECPGVEGLGLERMLPPVPFLVAVDQNREIRPDLLEAMAGVKLERGPLAKLRQQREALTAIVETLVSVAEKKAVRIGDKRLEEAEHKIMESLKIEYERLRALSMVNPNVRNEELSFIEDRLNAILYHLEESRTRLDAVRLILMTP